MEFGEFLRKYRETEDIDQIELSIRMDVSLSSVQNYENGRTKPGRFDLIDTISEAWEDYTKQEIQQFIASSLVYDGKGGNRDYITIDELSMICRVPYADAREYVMYHRSERGKQPVLYTEVRCGEVVIPKRALWHYVNRNKINKTAPKWLYPVLEELILEA